jgi:hypothetical protein
MPNMTANSDEGEQTADPMMRDGARRRGCRKIIAKAEISLLIMDIVLKAH